MVCPVCGAKIYPHIGGSKSPASSVGNGVVSYVWFQGEQAHRAEQNAEMGGLQMGFQTLPGLPFLLEKNVIFRLDVHVTIASQAAPLAPDRAEYCKNSLQKFLAIFGWHPQVDGGVDSACHLGSNSQGAGFSIITMNIGPAPFANWVDKNLFSN